jgi:CAAD domains of cyanobacterial aminoacyl-tRNA synthetase
VRANWLEQYQMVINKIVKFFAMEATTTPQEYNNPSTENATAVLEGTNPDTLPKLPPTQEADRKFQEKSEQIAVFLENLPAYISSFFKAYRQPIITIGLIFAALIATRLSLAIIDALNGIPLFNFTLEAIGLGFTIWFISRYLIKASTRQELATNLENFKQQIIGES